METNRGDRERQRTNEDLDNIQRENACTLEQHKFGKKHKVHRVICKKSREVFATPSK